MLGNTILCKFYYLRTYYLSYDQILAKMLKDKHNENPCRRVNWVYAISDVSIYHFAMEKGFGSSWDSRREPISNLLYSYKHVLIL